MFVKPNSNLNLETTKGVIEITSSEYFILQDKNKGRTPLVINKEGVQKIEDFFEVQTEILGEGAILDNVYVKVRMTTPEGLKVERIGSANHRSLSNDIARAYAVEMAFKRACATAALEVLRKKYTGKEALPLLYSSFDEFKTEDSINQNVPVVNETSGETSKATETHNAPVATETPAETKNSDMVEANATAVEENPFAENKSVEENKAEQHTEEKPAEAEKTAEEKPVDDEVITSNLGAFVIKSNKYRNGVTLQELAEKDINYLNWLVKGDNMKGRYKEYQEAAKKFVEEAGINLPA